MVAADILQVVAVVILQVVAVVTRVVAVYVLQAAAAVIRVVDILQVGVMAMATLVIPHIFQLDIPRMADGEDIPTTGAVTLTMFGLGVLGHPGGAGVHTTVGALDWVITFQRA